MNLGLLYQSWQSMLVDVTNLLTFLLKLTMCKGTSLISRRGVFNCVHVLRRILLLVVASVY